MTMLGLRLSQKHTEHCTVQIWRRDLWILVRIIRELRTQDPYLHPWLPSYHTHLIYSPTLESRKKKLERRKELWEGGQETPSLLPKFIYSSSKLTGLCRSWTTIHSPRTTTPSDNQQETPGTDNNGQRETCVDLSTIECTHSLSKMRSIVRFKKKKVQGGTYRLNTYLSVKQGISGKKSEMIWNAIF